MPFSYSSQIVDTGHDQFEILMFAVLTTSVLKQTVDNSFPNKAPDKNVRQISLKYFSSKKFPNVIPNYNKMRFSFLTF